MDDTDIIEHLRNIKYMAWLSVMFSWWAVLLGCACLISIWFRNTYIGVMGFLAIGLIGWLTWEKWDKKVKPLI